MRLLESLILCKYMLPECVIQCVFFNFFPGACTLDNLAVIKSYCKPCNIVESEFKPRLFGGMKIILADLLFVCQMEIFVFFNYTTIHVFRINNVAQQIRLIDKILLMMKKLTPVEGDIAVNQIMTNLFPILWDPKTDSKLVRKILRVSFFVLYYALTVSYIFKDIYLYEKRI